MPAASGRSRVGKTRYSGPKSVHLEQLVTRKLPGERVQWVIDEWRLRLRSVLSYRDGPRTESLAHDINYESPMKDI